MAKGRTIRLLRTAVGMVIGFLLMRAAVAVAYQGWLTQQRTLGMIMLVAVGIILSKSH